MKANKPRIPLKPARVITVLLSGLLLSMMLMHVCAEEVPESLKKDIAELEKEAKNEPVDVEALKKLGQRYGWAKMPDKAIATYERVLVLEPDNTETMKKLAELYSWNKMPEKSLEMMGKILVLTPDDIELKKELAKRYVWQKEQIKAIGLYEDVVEAEPDNVDLRRSLSDLYRWNKMEDKAQKQYEEIVKLDPEDYKTKEMLAFHYSWHDKPEEAIKLFEDIVIKFPENVKARKQLAHLYYYNKHQEEAIKQYDKLLDAVTTDAERADVYGKMAGAFQRTKDYGSARDYYKEILRLYPESVEAQERMAEINRLMSPQVFAQVDLFKAKGAETRTFQRYGFSQVLSDGYSMEAAYGHKRTTEQGERRIVAQSGKIEISKDLGNGLTFFGGGSFLYYGMDEKARVAYFARLIKAFSRKFTAILRYSNEPEDSDLTKLQQDVDRHTLNANFYYRIDEKYFDISGSVWGTYLTKGEAPNNNAGVGFVITPIIHIIEEPRVDLSYNYYRVDYLRKDPGRGPIYEYFNPKLYYNHSASLYISHWIVKDKVNGVLSNRIFYVVDVDDVNYWGHSLYAGLDIKLTKDDTLNVGFTRAREIRHVQDSYQLVQQVTVRFSHNF